MVGASVHDFSSIPKPVTSIPEPCSQKDTTREGKFVKGFEQEKEGAYERVMREKSMKIVKVYCSLEVTMSKLAKH